MLFVGDDNVKNLRILTISVNISVIFSTNL